MTKYLWMTKYLCCIYFYIQGKGKVKGKYHIERAVTLYLKANLCTTISQSYVLSGTHLTTQFPSHGLGEPVSYGFQTFANGTAL